MTPWSPLDPDDIADSLEVLLAVHHNGNPVAGWQFIDTDPAEHTKMRLQQRMYCARYGRIDYWSWDDREVQELNEAIQVLSDILKGENPLSMEDRT